MKTLIKIAILPLLLGVSLFAGNGYPEGYRDGWHDGRHDRREPSVRVVVSEPVYEEVVSYRPCRRAPSHGGAVVGALIGGIIGHHLDTRHPAHTTIGGAVAGAIIGSKIDDSRRGVPECRYVETVLKGYRNIAYWRGERIEYFSERPMERIPLPLRRR